MIAELPEIREADAPADIACLFRRMRERAPMSQINLVYRHLATLPGMLAWTWHVLEPAYASGALDRAGARLSAAIAMAEEDAPIWSDMETGPALDLRRVLDSYERANAQNVVALTALQLGMRAGLPTHQSPTPVRIAWDARPVVALPRVSDLSEAAQQDVRALAALHEAGEAGVIPSMYLHLALWPRALSVGRARLGGYVGTAEWRQRKTALLQAVRQEARALLPTLSASLPAPTPEILMPASSSIDLFVTGTIPDMMLVVARLSGGSPR